MMKKVYALCFLLWAGSGALIAQPPKILSDIFQAAFDYEPLQQYFYDEKGLPQPVFLLNRRPVNEEVAVIKFGKAIEVVRASQDETAFMIQVEKLKFKPRKAKLKFVYNDNTKVSMMIVLSGQEWIVNRAYIRQIVEDADGNRSKKVNWTF